MTIQDRTPRRFLPREEVLAIVPEALEKHWPSAFWDDDESYSPPRGYRLEEGVAVVTIEGPLETRGGWWFDGYGGPRGIGARVCSALEDPAALSVLLVIDSPGGACSGLFECLDAIRATKVKCKKSIIAYTEGGAFSAGYALATVADKIVVGRAAGVGSVGVIAVAASFAKQLEGEGVQIAVVASGEQKTDLHPMLPLSDGAVGRLRARVGDLALMFAAEVGRSRGLTPAEVLALQAGCFFGTDAVNAKLADSVATYTESLALARPRVAAPSANKPSGTLAALRMQAGATMEELVKKICAALGLPETATEEEILAAIEAMKASCATAQEDAQSAKKLLDQIRGEQDNKERAALVLKGRTNGTLTPHREKTLVPTLSTQQLRDLVADDAPRAVPDPPPPPPASGASVQGKRWEEMTSMEKHNLYSRDRAAYNALRDEYKQRNER